MYLLLSSFVYRLVYIRVHFCILKGDLVFPPGIRDYCVGKDIAASKFAKYNLAVGFPLQKAYRSHGRGYKRFQVKRDVCDLFDMLAQGQLFKVR